MSKIKELFFREAFLENRNVLCEDVEKFLQYINEAGDEGSQFDAKDVGKILNDNLKIDFDLIRTQLGKHVSAMSNTSGGLLAIGIKESKGRKSTFKTNNYDLTKVNLQNLQRALTTAVEPKVEFYVETVEMQRINGIPKGIILIFIEQSKNPPHQVVHNRTYYFRHGESSEPASHSLIQAMFYRRRNPKLEVDVIKVGNPLHQRILLKNQGTAPAHHTHIVINIFPRLLSEDEVLLSKRLIERTTDGLWNIKSFLGSKKQNFMKFRFRAKPSEIILPGVNEILFDFPFETYDGARMTVDIYCDGNEGHQEFNI
ncbi:MAG: ATP-binding protein [Bacteriovoracaceae bacterium]|nr:ATP-binding protein [Bacteriovoracaceae bacterium]